MPMTEQSITTGGTMTEQSLQGDDYENLYDAGPYDIGRFDTNLVMNEESISAQ